LNKPDVISPKRQRGGCLVSAFRIRLRTMGEVPV
jgi:hypothetical protein